MEFIKIKKPQDRKNMNWAEAKWAFPKLRPNQDTDRDGVKNQFDCRPLNSLKQDDEGMEERIKMRMEELGAVKKKAHLNDEEMEERIKVRMEDWGFSRK